MPLWDSNKMSQSQSFLPAHEFMPTPIPVNSVLPLIGEEGKGYYLLKSLDRYKELYEYASLADTLNFPLPDLPCFEEISRHSYFKSWFLDHWRTFAVKKLDGISFTNSPTRGNKVTIDLPFDLEKLIPILESYENGQIKDGGFESPIFDIDDSEINEQNEPFGFSQLWQHLSRHRLALQAIRFYESKSQRNEIHKDMIKIEAAHQLGMLENQFINRIPRGKSISGQDILDMERDYLDAKKIHKTIMPKNFCDELKSKSDFYTYADWGPHETSRIHRDVVDEAKRKVSNWAKQCESILICLGHKAFPYNKKLLDEIGIKFTKNAVPTRASLDTYYESELRTYCLFDLPYYVDSLHYDEHIQNIREKDIEGIDCRDIFKNIFFIEAAPFSKNIIRFEFNSLFLNKTVSEKSRLINLCIDRFKNSKDRAFIYIGEHFLTDLEPYVTRGFDLEGTFNFEIAPHLWETLKKSFLHETL